MQMWPSGNSGRPFSMEPTSTLIPHLFRTEYRKITAVLCKSFGIGFIVLAEDIVSDTFLLASETWGLKGLPPNPVGWLYTVAKNKAKDLLKHNEVFEKKVIPGILQEAPLPVFTEIDLSDQNITDSQLQMMFALCHPCIAPEAQIGLCLNILCGFGVDEIADAFLTNRETIYKRLARAKDKLRKEQIKIELPIAAELNKRLAPVLTTLYLLFSEGYYSTSQNTTLRQELCVEAMRLTLMLVDNVQTNSPLANALLALMCFHASRFDARINADGDNILYGEQDESLWNQELIQKGIFYLMKASNGNQLSKYHLEAAIAYQHTQDKDSPEKWHKILQLYNKLLIIEYSPVAALNRTYALAKADGKQRAILEAEKLQLSEDYLYHVLLADLYTGINDDKVVIHLNRACCLAKTGKDRKFIAAKLAGAVPK